MTTNNTPVTVADVSFSYQEENKSGTICDINLQITKGECILLCGKSGCGKTTMIKLINGLIPHFESGEKSGTVYIDGKDIDDLEPYQLSEKMASVFQNPKSQFFNIEPESEIIFTIENQGVPLGIIEKRLWETVTELNISHLMDKTMFGMSGGEKQIIAMACAYATDTAIVILDEPSANLDERATNIIARIIAKMKRDGKTIIIAEHRVAYLQGIVDRAVLVENGKISNILSADAFYNQDEQWRKAHGLRQLKSKAAFSQSPTQPLALESMRNQLSVNGLALSHGKQTIASDICFDICSGEIIALVGENGAGKTTLSRCLCGLFKEVAGDITLNGKTLNAKQRRKAAYMVMQDVNHQLFSESVLAECSLGRVDTT